MQKKNTKNSEKIPQPKKILEKFLKKNSGKIFK